MSESEEKITVFDDKNEDLGDEKEKGNGKISKYSLEKRTIFQTFLEWVVPYVVVCAIAVALFLCFRIVKVSGSSMNDTYKEGDTVIVNAAFYSNSEKGDIIVINATETSKPLIKRVIAVGGDEIDIDFTTGTIKINGEILEESYIKEPTTKDNGAFTYPVTVPDNHYFVLGDNRNNSIDSRHPSVGFVSQEDILGNVIFKLPF